jgi:putative ABC transport system substrate-binding protein
MKRREFITVLGGAAAAWPVSARTQPSTMPVIGSLHSASKEGTAHFMAAFQRGLNEVGYVEGQNLAIEYRWANGSYERLAELMAALVTLRVGVIVAFGTTAIRAAKAGHATGPAAAIPIVFAAGNDPVADGIVASLNRPGGNITGVTSITGALASKRLELLREFVPNVATVGFLVNVDNSISTEERRDAEIAARALGRRLRIVNAHNERDLDQAFVTLAQEHVGAVIVGSDTFFLSRMSQIASLATRHSLPAIAPYREFVTAGGLMSYGASISDTYRQAGVYTGRVLKGAKPADLPILQPTKFELVINLKTATALGLTVPNALLVAADEVIE